MAKIIIAGMGKVGSNLALALSKEGHNLLVIEMDPNLIEQAETIDALIIHGNPASLRTWEEPQLANADHFIGVTGSDEINMVACAIAKSRGCRTIARIMSKDYTDTPVELKKFKDIGIDVAICPELVAAVQMTHLIASSSLLNSKKYAKGKVHILDAKVTQRSKVLGKRIKDLELPEGCNIGTIFRGTDVLIPTGKSKFQRHDFVQVIIGDLAQASQIKALFGREVKTLTGPNKVQKIMIYGATDIAIALAQMLIARGMSVFVMEPNDERCHEVSELVPKAVVLKGSATDPDTLKSEEIGEVDIFIAATSTEEENIMSSLLAKESGAKTVMALIRNIDIKNKLDNIGIDMLINPKAEMVSSTLKFTMAKAIVNVDLTARGDAQIIEIKVPAKSKWVGKKIKTIGIFKKNAHIGAIIRNKKVIVPRGDSELFANDHLLIFTKTQMIRKLNKLVKKG